MSVFIGENDGLSQRYLPSSSSTPFSLRGTLEVVGVRRGWKKRGWNVDGV